MALRTSDQTNSLDKATAFFGGAELPAQVWSRKYRLRDKDSNFLEDSPIETFCRLADAVGAESDSTLRKNLVERRFIPGGRILFALGNPYFTATQKNCYVLSLKGDSLEAISDLRKEMARTYAMGGGVGIDLSLLRPAGAGVNNCALTSSGAASFSDGFSHLTGEIGQNGRRGALMLSMSVDHPDIQRFIQAKNDFDHNLANELRNRLPRKLYKKLVEEVIEPRRACSNSNMSVRVTDRFMKAVKGGKPHITRFVMDSGEMIEDVFDAKALFKEIVEGAWAHGCPGCIFWDTMTKEDNRNYLDERWHIVTTNPCFPGRERLHTDQGMVTFKELYDSQQAITATVDNRALDGTLGVSAHPAVPVYLTAQEEDVFKVTTKEGYEVDATPYHKFYVEDGERVELRNLVVGQKIMVQSGKGQFGEQGGARIGNLLGLVTGDGHFTNRGKGQEAVVVSLWESDQPLVEEVAEFVSEICHEHSIKGPWKTNGIAVAERRETRIRSTVLARYLKETYKFSRENKHRVPEVVWRGTEECVKAYLQALFQCDGTVNAIESNSCCTIRLASSYPELLKDVQKLLANFGIFSRIHKRRKAGQKMLPNGKGGQKLYDVKAQYEVIIGSGDRDRFMEEIGFLLPEKTEKYLAWKANHHRSPWGAKFLAEIKKIEFVGRETVYCTTQQNKNTIIVSACVVSNCGEQPLSDGGSCNLGSINLAKFTKHAYTEKAEFDWDAFKQATRDGIRFLDEINTIELKEDRSPLPKQAEVTESLRQVGLGVMGYADLLLQHQIKYGSDEAFELTERLFRVLRDTAYHESTVLSEEKGPFPAFDWDKIKRSPFIDRLPAEIKKRIETYGLRNSNVLSIAPTGTIAIMGETTGGIEPEFAFHFTRAVMLGNGKRTKFTMLSPAARRIAKALGKSVPQGEAEGPMDMSWLPEWATASHQISPKCRVQLQGLVQHYIDTAISSTVNLPESATVEDVMEIYWEAYTAGCKGITVYREGSREGILQTLQEEERLEFPVEPPVEIQARRISFKGENGLQRIIINVGDYRPGVPCEVVVTHGKSGTEVASYASALGIVTSIALQNGVHPDKIARALQGINAGWASRLRLDGPDEKPTLIQSVPDAVAAVLSKNYGKGIYEKGLAGQPINGASNKIGWELTSHERTKARTCPKCQKQSYIPDQSCWKCINPACDVDGVCG